MTKSRKHKIPKDRILIISILSIFLLIFLTYGYSLIKKQEEHKRNLPLIITKKEEDPEYNAYCDSDIKYDFVNSADLKGDIMVREVLVTITNTKTDPFYKWTLKIFYLLTIQLSLV